MTAALPHELLCGNQEFLVVGKKRLFITKDFQLHKSGAERLARQLTSQDGVPGIVAACGVGKNVDFVLIYVAEEGFSGFVIQVDPANGDGYDLRATYFMRPPHCLKVRIFAGTENES